MNVRQRKLRDELMCTARSTGILVEDIAAIFQVSIAPVYSALRGRTYAESRPVEPKPRAPRADPARERTALIAERYKAGLTLEQIGAEFGITRERVRQILRTRCGLTGADGGAAVRKRLREPILRAALDSRTARQDAKKLHAWGLTIAEYKAHVAEFGSVIKKGSPMYAFINQRRTANFLNDKWQFVFKDWWAFWRESGKWELRGRGDGYCMCRKDTSGPYAIGNVDIKTNAERARESFATKPGAERWAKGQLTRLARQAASKAQQIAA